MVDVDHWNDRWETEQEVLGIQEDPYSQHMVWENEGGKPKMDADWEPSESEVFTISAEPKLSAEQMKYRFTCLMADGIRHVQKFFFNRVEAVRDRGVVLAEPTIAQQIGEFVTELRRLLHGKYADLVDAGFRDLTNTDMWVNVAWPNPKVEYRWKYGILSTTGLLVLDLPIVQTLCENGAKMAAADKTTDEEFREINNTLNNLLREQTALDSLIYKARDLNVQAGTVVDNLCTIAEKLQESING